MDFDAFLKQLQAWTNKVPLIILGSGASIPFRLPSMGELGEHIKKTVTLTDSNDIEQFEKFKDLFNTKGDLEATLLDLQLRPIVLNAIVEKTWELVNQADLDAYGNIICNKEEFPLAKLVSYLLGTVNEKLSIVTTNYDRLAEYAASISEAVICTGYAQNYIGHFLNQIHTSSLMKLNGYKGQVNICKVHGSLDWFKTIAGRDIQLPLRHNIPDGFVPLIVTPGISKYSETHNEPYRTILTQADKEIDEANGYLCIGYGFNDIHVQPKLVKQIKSGKPIIVLSKAITPKTKQMIIDNNCKHYILMEDENGIDTKIYSSAWGEQILPNVGYWSLAEYLKIFI